MPTEADALGTGLDLGRDFDLEVAGTGSFGLIDGVPLLGRDLAFAVNRRVREEGLRGRRFDINYATDLRVAVEEVARRDSRVRRVVNIEVSRSESDTSTADVSVTIVAETDERGDFVFSI